LKLNELNILVTGSQGFVGTHLVNALKRKDVSVKEIDIKNGIDITNWTQLYNNIKTLSHIDVLFHLAAIVFIPFSFKNPRITYTVNTMGTLYMLEIARILDIKKFIFASSYVYGLPHYLPIDEHHPINVKSPYNRSKILGEELCKGYHEDYGLKCIILRPFNIYGKGQNEDFVIPSIIAQLPSNKIILENPNPKRDYVYVDDVVSAYIKTINYEARDMDIFNIGSGMSYSVNEIVGKIIHLAKRNKVTVSYTHKERKSEINNIIADIRKAKEKMNWQPTIDIDKGLSKMIKNSFHI